MAPTAFYRDGVVCCEDEMDRKEKYREESMEVLHKTHRK